MLIRPYTQDDFAAVLAIETTAFKPAQVYDEAHLKDLLSRSNYKALVAVEGDMIVGYALWRFEPDAYLDNIAVVPTLQKRGLGTQILEAVENDARGKHTILQLDVHPKLGPVAWYKKQGYVLIKEEGWVKYRDDAQSLTFLKGLTIEMQVFLVEKYLKV